MAYYKTGGGGLWTDLTPTIGASLTRSTQQILKLITTGGNLTSIYGAEATGDDLQIFANSNDSYPYIELLGDSIIRVYLSTTTKFVSYLFGGDEKFRIQGKGAIYIYETTTPTAIANMGAVYTKNDNKLYFQDGAGAEHEIAFV